jgi:hypothetical protein
MATQTNHQLILWGATDKNINKKYRPPWPPRPRPQLMKLAEELPMM